MRLLIGFRKRERRPPDVLAAEHNGSLAGGD
jgi:hypothetical protein